LWTVYLLIGVLSVGNKWWKWVAGIIISIVGLAYIALEFVPSIEPPANMR
jgi:putative Mn2+ efflux pump MntP